jgi:hypothetical protein
MPVTTSQSIYLTGPQIGEAVHLACKLFNKAEIKELCLVKLNVDLFAEAAAETAPLETIAYDLLGYVNRHGLVRDLLEALGNARPNDPGLRQLILRVEGTPDAATAGEQVGAFETALRVVTATAKTDSKFRETIGMSKVRFEVVRSELDRLARYKELHDCLHTLQMQLPAINRAARSFPAEPVAGKELTLYVDQLARQARRARKSSAGLLTEAKELAWIEDFDQALAAAQVAIRSAAAAPLGEAVDTLSRLLPEAVRINEKMNGAACRLAPALEELAKSLDDLPGRPPAAAGAGNGGIVDRLDAGVHALDGLAPQLAGLANTHDNWQEIETALSAAETAPNGPPPQRVPRWVRIKKLFDRVCPAGSITEPTPDPVELAKQWEHAADASTSENLFLTLRTAEMHEFKKVDDQLLDLTDRLTETLEPLDALLEII